MTERKSIADRVIPLIPRRAIPFLPKSAQRWLYCMRHLHYGRDTELALIPKLCNSRLMSVDIGANTGIHTLVMHQYSRAVIAFEPNPKLTRGLVDMFAGSTVRIETVALGRSNERAHLTVPTFGGCEIHGWARLRDDLATLEWRGQSYTGSEQFEVPIRRLDEYALREVGFIKIDVEGYEEEVLAGAQQTISDNRPRLMIEIETRHSPDAAHLERMLSSVCNMGYTGYFVRRGRLEPLSSFDASTMQSPTLADVSPDYVNNFVFLPIDESSSGEPRGTSSAQAPETGDGDDRGTRPIAVDAK